MNNLYRLVMNSEVVPKEANEHTPKSMGFYMPAEWERQEAIWLSWPHNSEWWGKEISEVEQSFGQFAQALYTGQEVRILVPDADIETRARQVLDAFGVAREKVQFYPIATGEIYIRDYGPTFLVRRDTGEKAMVNWEFNAWGGKYENSLNDTQVPDLMNTYLNLPMFNPGIIMEGGAIDVNGCGIVLTTESGLLNKNRNPQLGKKDLERYLSDYTGVSRFVWLNQGLVGDDTDGHIDDIARFVSPTTVLCAYENDRNEENYARLHENYERLVKTRDLSGRFLDVLKMPMAHVESGEHSHTGSRHKPASYLNFYIGNDAVVVPVFGEENEESDEEALRMLGLVFPQRKIVGVDCAKMILGGGTLHCASQQEPRGR